MCEYLLSGQRLAWWWAEAYASVFGPAKEGGVHAYQSDCVRGETTENDRLENSL